MADVALYRLSIQFALVTGTGAGILAALSWRILRESPFGLPLKLLAVVMSLATIYHGGLLVVGSQPLALQSLQMIGYVLVSVALVAVVSELPGRIRNQEAIRHPYVVFATVLGVVLYAVGGPLSEAFFRPARHWIHGFAALFAIGGLYSPVHHAIWNEPWSTMLSTGVTAGRQHAEWMVPMDDAILEVLYSSGLILTPAVVAYNIDHSREEVNRRLTVLESEDLVERIERGKYRLANRGERYVEGDSPGSV